MTVSSLQTFDPAAVEYPATGTIAVDSLVIIGDRIGLALNAAASGDRIPVAMVTRITKIGLKLSGEAWKFGDRIYYDESAAKFTTTKKRVFAGIAASAHASTATVADVILGLSSSGPELIDNLVVNTDSVGNLAAETAFAKTITLKANTVQPGDIIRLAFQGIVTAQNSTDTHRARLRVGATSLGATVLIDTTAVDPGTNDIFGGEIDLIIRSIGAAGKAYGRLREQGYLGAPGTAATKPGILAEFTFDTTIDELFSIGMTHSVQNAGNTDRLDAFYAQKIR